MNDTVFPQKGSLEQHFEPFRQGIVGYDQKFETPYGSKRIVYTDWIASGRLYAPIERAMLERFGPFVGNTHSESSVTGTAMTYAYKQAQKIIKQHVGANDDDVLLMTGTGMTGAVCKFQRLLGLYLPEKLAGSFNLPANERPVVFVTHMEHHSNHTSWLETLAEVVRLEPDADGLVDPASLRDLLPHYADRPMKLGAFTACSNVTGVQTPYYELARIMHAHGGSCFVDFAASAPYVDIDMHPDDPLERLDALSFSPHKFLGGPGSSGVLIFGRHLYNNRVPDHPGGGTVNWTNPWGKHSYISDIETREDGGTPGFLQTIRAALCTRLKEQMSTQAMQRREGELLPVALQALKSIPGLHILADGVPRRLGVISFYVDDLHFNLIVKLLNDRFGIQMRGGCSCAGTYGHYLLHVDEQHSKRITERIDSGDLSEKPGWVRFSLHPTMTDSELAFVIEALKETVENAKAWAKDYGYSATTNEFTHLSGWNPATEAVESGFRLA